LLSEKLGVHRESNSQNGSSFGRVRVHSLTLSYILGSMKCDSRASFLAHTFASLCFSRELNVRVMTNKFNSKMKIKALSNYQITRMYDGRNWKQMSPNKNEKQS
jgi:hypothetical protein